MYAQEYVDNEVLNVEPLELVCLLYSKAIEKLHQARDHLAADRLPERGEAIGLAMEIVVELKGSLNEEGGEIAVNLARLYDYLIEKLAEAHAEQKMESLNESLRLLSTLHEGWKEARSALAGTLAGSTDAAVAASAVVQPVAVEAAEAGVERAWTV